MEVVLERAGEVRRLHGGEGLVSGQRPNVAQRGLLFLGAQPLS